MTDAEIIPASVHGIDQTLINKNAITLLKKLRKAGFQAYLVGGCVRDLLLERQPKDFDIATDASPEAVKKVFRHCHLIGRRFRIAHVRIHRDIFEVTTFRGETSDNPGERTEQGILLSDNVYGTIDQDAIRRDFTVNALYYDVKEQVVLDFCGGMEDIQQKTLRMIGDPAARYREDPVRILRAIRFASKLQFSIEPDTAAPIEEFRELLLHVSPSRLYLETQKLFMSGYAHAGFDKLRTLKILDLLFPEVSFVLDNAPESGALEMINQALINTDERIVEEKPVTPIFLLAVFLWEPLQRQIQQLMQEDYPFGNAYTIAVERAIAKVLSIFNIPRRAIVRLRDIWRLQHVLERRRPGQCIKVLENPRFRAAYDFLLLREVVNPELHQVAKWWTVIQEKDMDERMQMIKALPKPRRRRNKKR